MVIPEDQDGKGDQCLALQRGSSTLEKNTRQGGRTETQDARKLIVVDMREFRSELPALIHKRGIEIEPLTITVSLNYNFFQVTTFCVMLLFKS